MGAGCFACGATEVTRVDGPPAPWQYVACARCHHASLVPMPNASELREHYNSAYMVPLDAYLGSTKRHVRTAAAAIGARPPGRMLEVGCSYGAVLAAFRSRGWDVEGIELDARTAAWGREHFGLTVHTGDLAQVRNALHPPYDVIAMYHVIEHIPDPRPLLAEVRELLARDGVLVIRTPNVRSAIATVAQGWWEWALAPEHVHLFSPESLTRVLADAGFTTDGWKSLRGDATGIVTELLRTSARRAMKDDARHPARSDGSAPAPAPAPPRFPRVRRALNVLATPLDTLVAWGSAFGLPGGAELVLTARRG